MPSSIRSYDHVQAHEREAISQALRSHGGNKSRAAQALGLTLRQLNYRIQVLGLREALATPRKPRADINNV